MTDVFASCIDAVHAHVEEALSSMDPAPTVSRGNLTLDRPFAVAVHVVPTSVSVSDRATSSMGASGARGCYRVEFNVDIEMAAVRATDQAAASTVLSWFEAVARAVALDKTLGGACVHAQPFLSVAATGARDRQRIGAVDCGVTVKAEIDPTK